MTSYILDTLDHEALLALSWCAPLLTDHLQLLVAANRDASGFRRRLGRLGKLGLVDTFRYYRRNAGGPPIKKGYVWSITARGFDRLDGDPRRPTRMATVRRSVVDHDLQVGNLLSRMVATGRPVLSGVRLTQETHLDDETRRPRCDAIVVLSRAATPTQLLEAGVPWLTAPLDKGDKIRAWAVEVDRGTEGLAVIREKARRYRTVWSDPTYYERYGSLPIPLWVATTQQRAQAIHGAWLEVWPEGRWYMTDDDHVPELSFTECRAGQQRDVHLLDGWC